MNWAWEGMVKVELEGRAFPCGGAGADGSTSGGGGGGGGASDPGLTALGIFPGLIPRTGRLGLVASALERGLGEGCVADGGVLLDFYGITASYGLVSVFRVCAALC